MRPREILCIGLNPAFQTTLHFTRFAAGRVNRAFRKSHSIGGKGQNFAIACQQYGHCDGVTVLQFVGGSTGQFIRSVLDEKNIHHIDVITEKPTRLCTTVLDFVNNATTELIEPSSSVSPAELDQFKSYIDMLLATDQDSALCGTYPIGVDGRIYEYICDRKPENVFLLLDAYKDMTGVLQTGKVDVLKINCEEACQLVKMDMTTDICPQLGNIIMKQYKIKFLAITNGPSSAFLFISPNNYVTFSIPSLKELMVGFTVWRKARQDEFNSTNCHSTSLISNDSTLTNINSTLSATTTTNNNLSTTFVDHQVSSPSLRMLTRFNKFSDSSASLPSPVTVDADADVIPRSRKSRLINETNNNIDVTSTLSTMSSTIHPASSICHEISNCNTAAINSLSPFVVVGDSARLNNAETQLTPALEDKDDEDRLVLNPLGAGDTCSGVFVASYLESGDIVDAYRCGLAAASASCLVIESTAHFDKDVMMYIYERITTNVVE